MFFFSLSVEETLLGAIALVFRTRGGRVCVCECAPKHSISDGKSERCFRRIEASCERKRRERALKFTHIHSQTARSTKKREKYCPTAFDCPPNNNAFIILEREKSESESVDVNWSNVATFVWRIKESLMKIRQRE